MTVRCCITTASKKSEGAEPTRPRQKQSRASGTLQHELSHDSRPERLVYFCSKVSQSEVICLHNFDICPPRANRHGPKEHEIEWAGRKGKTLAQVVRLCFRSSMLALFKAPKGSGSYVGRCIARSLKETHGTTPCSTVLLQGFQHSRNPRLFESRRFRLPIVAVPGRATPVSTRRQGKQTQLCTFSSWAPSYEV